MRLLSRYIIFQILFLCLALAYMFLAGRERLEYVVFFPVLSALVFIIVVYRKMYLLSDYLQSNHAGLYQKRVVERMFYKHGLRSVNVLAIKKEEIKGIPDAGMRQLVGDLKLAYKTLIISIAIMMTILIAWSFFLQPSQGS